MINCPNCNSQIDENSKFCNKCGFKTENIKIEGNQAEVEQNLSTDNNGVDEEYQQPVEQEYQQPVEQEYQQPVEQEYQQPVEQEYQQTVEQEYQEPVGEGISKGPSIIEEKIIPYIKENKKKVLILSVATVILLMVLFALPKLFNDNSNSIETFIYSYDDQTYLKSVGNIKTPKKGTIIGDDDFMYGDQMILSKDNKRLFYLESPYRSSGELCYKNTKSLKKDAIKISNDVTEFKINDKGNKVYYLDDDYNLYMYNLSKSTRIDREVRTFYLNSSTDKIVYTTYDNDLYIKIGKKDKKRVDHDARIIFATQDLSKVYYTVDEELYVLNEKGKTELVDENFESVVKAYETGELYYLAEAYNTNKYSDYIYDDMEEHDSNMQEIEKLEYPNEYGYLPDREVPKAPDRNELYEEFINQLNSQEVEEPLVEEPLVEEPLVEEPSDEEPLVEDPLDENQDQNQTLEEAFAEFYNERYDAYEEDYNNYYKEWEEKFYAAVKEYEDQKEKYKEYEEKLNRDEIRDRMKEYYHEEPINTLYFYDGSSSKIVTEGYVETTNNECESPFLIIKGLELNSDFEKVNISDIESIYNMDSLVRGAISENIEKIIVYKENVFDSDLDMRDIKITKDGKSLYYVYYSDLYNIKFEKNKMGDEKLVAEDIREYFILEKSNKIAYINYDEELYVAGKKVDVDVSDLVINLPGTDSLYYLTELNSKETRGTLKRYSKGKVIKITEDASPFFIPLNSKYVLVLQDYSSKRDSGSLYLYKGKRKTKVAEDIDDIALIPSMGNYDYYKK